LIHSKIIDSGNGMSLTFIVVAFYPIDFYNLSFVTTDMSS